MGMWDIILNEECRNYMHNLIQDEEGVIGEDDKVINAFFDYVRENVQDYKIIVVLATQWKMYEEEKQVSIAIKYVGWVRASHFIMLMDYLSDKFLKGELK